VPPTPGPLGRATAFVAVARCVATSAALLARGQVRVPSGNVGRVIAFADGTSARVYRETVTPRVAREPCFLAVTFRLRGVPGPVGHALFRRESLLNTPLFVGFPGFLSKLWLAHDARGRYRGLYEWDGASRAEHYARSLWRVLEVVSVRGSIDYRVVPGLHRDEALARPALLPAAGDEPWWRVI
jgi:hypothetical protein